MKIAVYPGTFDPVTYGHLDIAKRAAELFDKVIIAVANENYKNNLFTLEERLDILKQVVQGMDNVRVETFDGLLINYVEQQGAQAIIRGLRAVSDFEFEFQLALMNKKLNENVETVFLMTASEYSFISSSIIKQVASLGGSVCGLVPPDVSKVLIDKYRKKGDKTQ